MNISELQDELTKRNIHLTNRDIAKIWRMNETSFSKKKSANTEIKYKNIEQLENALKINLVPKNQPLDELKERLETLSQNIDRAQEGFDKAYKNAKGDGNFVQLPVRGDVRASMGNGVIVYNEEKTGIYEISRKLLYDIGASPKQSEIIFTQGDSMSPTLEGGDSILVDYSNREIYDGKIYCVRINGQLYAKRLQKLPPSTIVVISDNPKYKSFEVDLSKELNYDFEVLGAVKWWGRIAR